MSAVDVFVIYDDIEYSKQSWINRNRLLLKNGIDYITCRLLKALTWRTLETDVWRRTGQNTAESTRIEWNKLIKIALSFREEWSC